MNGGYHHGLAGCTKQLSSDDSADGGGQIVLQSTSTPSDPVVSSNALAFNDPSSMVEGQRAASCC
jgi:hypothetical protein